jgi:60 kDa SS-A/Ro ribonucleoprotein
MTYSEHIANRKTPQMEKARADQVENSAGGFVFAVDDWTRLDRFLIIGNEEGTFYASERKLTVESYDTITKLLSEDGKKVVDRIVEISDSGRAPNNNAAVFALAVCSVSGDIETRTYVNKVMPKVCRFSTDFYTWINIVNELKSGRKSHGLKRAIGRWYGSKTPKSLAYQVCKYPSRSVDGSSTTKGKKWSHRDCLRISRPGKDRKTKSGKTDKALSIPTDKHGLIYRYAVRGIDDEDGISVNTLNSWKDDDDLRYIYGHEMAKMSKNSKELSQLIKTYNLTRESVPPGLMNKEVWQALLPGIPTKALIRNLGQMTSQEVFKPLSDETILAVDKITDEEVLKNSRIHPMNIILALRTYQSGHGRRTEWTPVPAICDALEKAFYASFKYVEPTGKKILIAVDVSGSMTIPSKGAPNITAREAAAVMAMVLARTEKNHHMVAFSSKGGIWGSSDNNLIVPFPITSQDSLKTVIETTGSIGMGWTDCSLPMMYAIENEIDVDAFVILTDNETWSGPVHPFEAMKQYREKFNQNAKLASLAFEGTKFTVADPSDAGMIDVIGLDSSVPAILSDFISNKI